MNDERKNLPTQTVEQSTAISEAQSPLADMFAGIMEVVKDPDVSPEKMSALLDVQERMINRQALMDFNKAKMQAMAEMPIIDRNGAIKNKAGQVQSRYARFEDIDRIVRPICAKYGLVYSFNISEGERGATKVTCELGHVGGHVEHYGPLAVPLDTSGSKNPTQGVGSSVSYGKRYTLCAALNIVTLFEDNDGQTATKTLSAAEPDFADELRDQAQRAAVAGSQAYTEFFSGLSPMKKGWLVEYGGHAELKNAAAEHDQG